MSNKVLGIVLVVVGVLIAVVVVLSGPLNFPHSLFTPHKQIAEYAVAVIALVAGLVMLFSKPAKEEPKK
ncbi:MAG: hypothetical protein WCE68_13035 [Anaerolineales bacterium]